MKKLLLIGLGVLLLPSLVANELEEHIYENLLNFYRRGGQSVEMATQLAQTNMTKVTQFFRNAENLTFDNLQVGIMLAAVKLSYIKDVIINMLRFDYENLALDSADFPMLAERVVHRLLGEMVVFEWPMASSYVDNLVDAYERLQANVTIVLIEYLQEYKPE